MEHLDCLENEKTVYTLIEREGEGAAWVAIGAGFTAPGGVVNLKLGLSPTLGALQVRDGRAPTKAGAR